MSKQSSLKSMVLCLGIICLASSAALSTVYLLTKEPIAAAMAQKENNAIQKVMPAFDNNPYNECSVIELNGKQYQVFPAKKGSELLGYAIKAYSSKGFGGAITLMVGIKIDGTISNIEVISHEETPGLGANITLEDSHFRDQFMNLDLFSVPKVAVKKDGGTLDAITSATISSRAFCDAVDIAGDVFKKIK